MKKSFKGEAIGNVMKGNFITKKQVVVKLKDDESLEARFEKEAMKRIGGSIAFVSKQKVKWNYKEKGQ